MVQKSRRVRLLLSDGIMLITTLVQGPSKEDKIAKHSMG